MSSKPRKPIVPTQGEVDLADRILLSVSDLPAAEVASSPQPIRSALDDLSVVASTVAIIRRDQPLLLEKYAPDLTKVVQGAVAVSDEDASTLVMALMSSVTMARMLGDVASGQTEPVAATPRVRKATAPEPEKTEAAEPDPAPADPAPAAPKAARRSRAKVTQPVAVKDEPVAEAPEPVAVSLAPVAVEPAAENVPAAVVEPDPVVEAALSLPPAVVEPAAESTPAVADSDWVDEPIVGATEPGDFDDQVTKPSPLMAALAAAGAPLVDFASAGASDF